jgi:molybdopterin-containing oxidoreductase family membrane subunit
LFAGAVLAVAIGVAAFTYLLVKGVGVWGLNRTVGWAYDITNFVFWIGIGHAGTLISAVLLLFRQPWRTGVNRTAELTTLIAIVCAAVFPALHLGRAWLFWWLLPLPNSRGPLWPNFASPLTWDVFAIGTYFIVSLLFCWLGLVPDFATLRNRSRGLRRRVYRALALGWDGSRGAWAAHRQATLLLAGIATPLVVSVHSIVSFDFAVSLVPGWHTTVFPPYFVVGAVFSGMALLLALLIIVRKALALEPWVTLDHVDAMCKLLLATGLMLAMVYALEVTTALVGDHPAERALLETRALGPIASAWWIMLSCNVLVPQLLWARAVRRDVRAVFSIALIVTVGMWLERFVIVVGSMERDYLPSAWVDYLPTRYEVATLVGSLGLFLALFLLCVRFLPLISMSELAADAHARTMGTR